MVESTNLMEEMVDRGMTNLTDELANLVLRINTMCTEKDAEIERLKAELKEAQEAYPFEYIREAEAQIERLTAERDQWKSNCELRSQTASDRLEALKKLEAENAKLLALLKEYSEWADPVGCDDPALRAIRERMRAAVAEAERKR